MSSPISVALSSYEKDAVLNVIKADPSWKTVDQLGDAFAEQATAKPYNVDKIADIIAALEVDPAVPTIKTRDSNRQPIEKPFAQILRAVIFDLLQRQFDDKSPVIEPANAFLISALISGAAVRSGLCNSSVQSGMIALGLRLERSRWQDMISPNKYEVWVVHAALHLLVGGRRMYREEQIAHRQAEILPALKAIAEQNIVVHPQGKALLEAAIAEAATGFETDLAIVDIWRILFP